MLIATCYLVESTSHRTGHLGTGTGGRHWQAWLHAAPWLTHHSIALHRCRCGRGDIFKGRCLSTLALGSGAARAMQAHCHHGMGCLCPVVALAHCLGADCMMFTFARLGDH